MTSNNDRKQKTKEPRSYSSFYTRHKKEVLDELKQSLSSPHKSTRHSSFDHSCKKDISKTENQSPPLSHYNNLDKFRDKFFAVPKQIKRLKVRIPSHGTCTSRPKFDNLSDIINLETLSRALKILKKKGINDMTWAYKRQLRQFSVEILRSFKDCKALT
jgi:hypothetical protein